MARAFLLSHGARQPEAGDTFVPEGKTISFYSEYDENTLRSVGLAAVNAGDIAPVDTFTGPVPIPNYLLAKFDDAAMAQHLAAESSQTGGTLYFVGSELPSPTKLCTSPDVCDDTYPQHAKNCGGVFTQIAEEEILSVSCRGVLGAPGKTTRTMEGSTDFQDENKAEGERILNWAKTDPEAAMEYWQSLTDITRVMIGSNYLPVRAFAENYFKSGGDSTPAAILEARRLLEAQGEDAFFDWSQGWDTKQRGIIQTDTELVAVIDRMTRTRLGLSNKSSGDSVATQIETVKAQATQLANVAASVTEEGGADSVSGLSTGFGTFMTEVQTLQGLASTAGSTTVEQAASRLSQVGADAGVKIALFQETPDAETLEGLKSAFAAVGQEAGSISISVG